MRIRSSAGAALFAALAAAQAGGTGDGEPAPARYRVEQGRFVDTTSGRPIPVRGFNYIRLHSSHGTFDPRHYNRTAADAMFGRLRADDFNAVRVFINGHAGLSGAVARAGQAGLSAPYLANLADFLVRAGSNGIAVVLSMDSFPRVPPYSDGLKAPPPEIHPANAELLCAGHVAAKAAYLRDFVAGVRAAAPRAPDAVLAWDLQNELCYAVAPPFAQTTGTVTAANGCAYRVPAQRQDLADDSAVHVIDTWTRAIREAQPGAVSWAGVFTYKAVGRSGPDDFRIEKAGWKNRVPFRPAAILRSKADVLDLHFYCADANGLDADLASVEWNTVRRLARERGVPVVAGEFGAFKSRFPGSAPAAAWMADLVRLLADRGIDGWLHWTYDTHEQDAELWHACADGEAIYRALGGR
jgi:hypothetical protein